MVAIVVVDSYWIGFYCVLYCIVLYWTGLPNWYVLVRLLLMNNFLSQKKIIFFRRFSRRMGFDSGYQPFD